MKLGCTAHVTASVDRKRDKLIVRSLVDLHCHDRSEAIFKMYPENRRMGEEEKQTAQKLLELNVEARRIVHLIKDISGREITNRDIFNLKANIKHDGKDEVNTLIDVLEEVVHNNGNVCFDIDQKDELNVLFFQSKEMSQGMTKFPEVLLLDGTYRCNDKKMTLLSILVEDGNGAGQCVAYGLIARETKDTIAKFLDFFVQTNPAVSRTEVVLIDKDFSELAALKKVIPNADVFLCLFHVLKAVRSKISSLLLPEEKKDMIREVFTAMAYARSEELYDVQYKKLKDVCDGESMEYFKDNWHSIRRKWVQYSRNNKYTMMNNTTNRIESHHQKVKAALKSHKKSLTECVKELLCLQDCREQALTHNVSLDKVSVRYRHGEQTDATAEMLATRSCTAYATSLMVKELNNAKRSTFDISGMKEENEYSVALKELAYRTTRADEYVHCTCTFYTTTKLPCRHIFAISIKTSQPVFAPSWVPERWHKSYQNKSQSDIKSGNGVVQSVIVQRAPPKAMLTRCEKFKQLRVVLNAVADLCSELGNQDFLSRFEQLTLLHDIWRNKKDCIIVCVDDVVVEDPANQAERGTTQEITSSQESVNHEAQAVKPDVPDIASSSPAVKHSNDVVHSTSQGGKTENEIYINPCYPDIQPVKKNESGTDMCRNSKKQSMHTSLQVGVDRRDNLSSTSQGSKCDISSSNSKTFLHVACPVQKDDTETDEKVPDMGSTSQGGKSEASEIKINPHNQDVCLVKENESGHGMCRKSEEHPMSANSPVPNEPCGHFSYTSQGGKCDTGALNSGSVIHEACRVQQDDTETGKQEAASTNYDATCKEDCGTSTLADVQIQGNSCESENINSNSIFKPNIHDGNINTQFHKLRLKLKLPISPLPRGRPKGAQTTCIGLPRKRKRVGKNKLSTKRHKNESEPETAELNLRLAKFREYVNGFEKTESLNQLARKVQKNVYPTVRNMGAYLSEVSNPAVSLSEEVHNYWEEEAEIAVQILSGSKHLLALGTKAKFDWVSYIQLMACMLTASYYMKCDPNTFAFTLQERPGHLTHTNELKRQRTSERQISSQKMRIGNCTFTKEDMTSLQQDNWLTDQVKYKSFC